MAAPWLPLLLLLVLAGVVLPVHGFDLQIYFG
jgi:hypothetical protein